MIIVEHSATSLKLLPILYSGTSSYKFAEGCTTSQSGMPRAIEWKHYNMRRFKSGAILWYGSGRVAGSPGGSSRKEGSIMRCFFKTVYIWIDMRRRTRRHGPSWGLRATVKKAQLALTSRKPIMSF
jgi:hypothetical protein